MSKVLAIQISSWAAPTVSSVKNSSVPRISSRIRMGTIVCPWCPCE
ncbi:MAG: hypothetical protein ACK5XO_15255 [Phycisphaerales bacterium]